MIKAIAFDLDGTLYPTQQMVLYSLPVTGKHFRFFMHFARVRKEIRLMRPIDDFHALQAELVAKRLAIPVSEARMSADQWVYRDLLRAYRRIRPFPHLAAVLQELKADGLQLAVLSDFPVQNKLAFLGLDGFWSCTFCSEESNYLKPNPEPFYLLSKRLACKVTEVLYVGNKYHYDILGAHQAGMKTAHFTRTPPKGSLADITFHNYNKFLSLVRGEVLA